MAVMVRWTDEFTEAAGIAGQAASSAVVAPLPAIDEGVIAIDAGDAVTAADATAHTTREATQDVIGVGFPSKGAFHAVAFVLA